MKQLFLFLLQLMGIKKLTLHYFIERKLRKIAIRVYGNNVALHDKMAYFGTHAEDKKYLTAINKEFDLELTSLYSHAVTTDSYRNYNSLALEIYNQLNNKLNGEQ